MIPIDQNTVAAQSYGDLVSAAGDLAINYIYLANDITLTGAVTINPAKAALTIDGEYPEGSMHRLTDVNSSSYSETLCINATSTITITMKNMIINGRNYYGVPFITESFGLTDTSGVSVIYENISYTGPQITFNRNGLTRYIDCDINIYQTGASPAQEVGEVNRVELGGNINILHQSTEGDPAVFWFLGNTNTMALTVLEDANVSINTVNSYFMYNMLPVFNTPYPLPYVIRPRASFSLQANKGISFNQYNQLTSFLVDENASFNYVQTNNNGTSSSVYINGALTVRQGASFYMEAANSAEPLIRFTSGTGRSLSVENPLSFVLYCANDPALISGGTTQFSFRTGQLNTWRVPFSPVASAGGFNDTPEFKWYKRDYALTAEFSGSFTQNSTTAASNLTNDDPPYPAITNIHLHEARVISMGDWPVNVNPIYDNGTPITGLTHRFANMRAVYDILGQSHTLNAAADENGGFSMSTSLENPPNIPAETVVAISSNIPFLIKETTATSIYAGTLLITSAPQVITFRIPPISTNPVILPRINPEIPVIIEDDRAEISPWGLWLSLEAPLQTEDGDILPEAVVFVQSEGQEPVTLGAEPILVYTAGQTTGETRVFWPENQGILIRVTEPMKIGQRYFTQVKWDLTEG